MRQNTQQGDWEGQGGKKQGQKAGPVSRKTRRGKKASGAFRTISEVASLLGVQQHVLRFWESKFSQVKPMKRGGGRRYYRPEDVELLQRIHHLLYSEGYTIRGVQKLLKSTRGSVAVLDKKVEETQTTEVEELKDTVAAATAVVAEKAPTEVSALKQERKEMLKVMLEELKAMRELIDA